MRSALRSLATAPALTAVVVIVLALGIGANTAVFSLLDEALLEELPVRDPQQLRTAVVISRDGATISNVPAELFAELRREPRAFSGVLACWSTEMNLDAGADVDRVLVQYVSGSYFSTLGVSMFAGRAIREVDENAADRPAVLSHRFWMRRFGGDPAVLGRAVLLNGLPAVVVGITPPEFFGLDRGAAADVTIALPTRAPFSNLWVTVRMRPGATDAQGVAEADAALKQALERIRSRLSRYRDADRQQILTMKAGLRPAAAGMEVAMRDYIASFRVLLLLSAGVLLIACVNVAHLLLARALARTHEFGVRLALGASRARLLRQVLAESGVLAVLGTALGVLSAIPIRSALTRLLLSDLAHQALAFRVDAHLLAYSSLLVVLTVVVVGLVPALRASRVDISVTLQRAAPRGRARRYGLAKALVVAQIAAALPLLVGAALLVRSFRELSAIDTGVALDRMVTLRVGLSPRETQQIQSTQIYADLVDRARAVPGVDSAALGWDYALGSGRSAKSIWVEGRPPETNQSSGFNVIGPGFFANAGIPVVLGREFTDADTTRARRVVVVNEAWVRRYAPGRNPIGLHVGDTGADSIAKYDVIGVVRDSRTVALRQTAGPMLYQPLMQDDWAGDVVLHVRVSTDPRGVAARVRDAIHGLNPHLPVYDETTLLERRAQALGGDRVMAELSSSVGFLALLLTTLGIYGVIAYTVGRRTAEIGIRMALGATSRSVRWMVVRETLALAAAGVSIGVPLALAGARGLASMLFGVGPQDPAALSGSVAMLLLVACVAGGVPASRAARLQPSTALRRE